jgi:hypothetical protein
LLVLLQRCCWSSCHSNYQRLVIAVFQPGLLLPLSRQLPILGNRFQSSTSANWCCSHCYRWPIAVPLATPAASRCNHYSAIILLSLLGLRGCLARLPGVAVGRGYRTRVSRGCWRGCDC